MEMPFVVTAYTYSIPFHVCTHPRPKPAETLGNLAGHDVIDVVRVVCNVGNVCGCFCDFDSCFFAIVKKTIDSRFDNLLVSRFTSCLRERQGHFCAGRINDYAND